MSNGQREKNLEKTEKILDLGIDVFNELKGIEIKTPDDALKVITILSEKVKLAQEDSDKQRLFQQKETSQTLKDLLANVVEIEHDSAELIFLTAKIKQLAKNKGIDLEQIEKYVMLGLKIALIVKTLI